MLFAFIITCFVLFDLAHSDPNEKCKSKITQYLTYDINDNKYVISNFDKFTDLTLNCSERYNVSGKLNIIPNKPIIIDRNFQMAELFDKKTINSIFYLFMYNFDGININTDCIQDNRDSLSDLIFIYIFSKLDLYNNNNNLITESQCNKSLFEKKSRFFSNLNKIFFNYVKYPESICPYVFLNSQIGFIYFVDITNSFLYKNLLNFIDGNFTITDFSNTKIRTLLLDMKYESLTTKILSKYAFKKILRIIISGVLNNIQTDLFLYFNNLKYLDLRLENFKDFFHRGNKWMECMNMDIKNYIKNKFNLKHSFIIRFKFKKTSLMNQIYEYPDEDFCLFEKFPHDNLVIPFFSPGKQIKCSCTVLWLIQYYSYYFDVNYSPYYYDNSNVDIYEDIGTINFDSTIRYCHNNLFKQSIMKCNFSQRVKNCQKANFSTTKANFDSEFNLNNDVDLLFLIKWFQFIFIIILQPILSCIGIINNILIIKIIRNKDMKKNFKDTMYYHIIINCYFNIIYCIITSLRIINQCLFFNSLFCPDTYYAKSTQYFTIIVIYFLGSVVKFCKNVTFLSFTISRYILSLNKKKGFYEKFSKMNLKAYLAILILISLILNLFKIFEYKVSAINDPTDQYPKEVYDERRCDSNFDSYCKFFNTMKLIVLFINNFSLYIINFIVDIVLLKDFSKHLKDRQKLVSNTKSQNDEEASNKTTRMAIISNLFYLITYLPELIVSIIITIYSNQISKFLFYISSVSSMLIVEEFEIFGLISVVSIFYNLIYFNKNFNISYQDFKDKIKMKFFQKMTFNKFKIEN